MSFLKRLVKRCLFVLIISILVAIETTAPILAARDSFTEQDAQRYNIYFLDKNKKKTTQASCSATSSTDTGDNNSGVNSKVTFKYGNGPRLKAQTADGKDIQPGDNITMEDWAKLMLKFIAFGTGTKESDVVTDEKVLALVAWQAQEGGSTVTVGAYNGLNVAKDPKTQRDLNPTYNHTYGDGNQHPAFKTLEEGVESNVRFIEKYHYSYILNMLLNPKLTADDFVNNIDNKTQGGLTGQASWAAGGYKSALKSVLNGYKSNPASKQRAFSAPLVGAKSRQWLQSVGVADGGIKALDISATKGGCGGGSLRFPLDVTKADFTSNNAGCIDDDAKTICKAGHPYTAYDLMIPEGTQVIAATDGTVTSAKVGGCGHGFGKAFTVQVYNKSEDRVYFYQHMKDDSGQVTKGQEIKAGDPIGKVGGAEADCNTAPHLHIDASQGSVRGACSRLSCPEETKKKFIDIGKELYTAYTNLK